MIRGAALLFTLAAACGCATKPTTTGGGGSGSGGCEAVRAKLVSLYTADAQASEPTRVDARVADNVAMAMNECARAPGAFVPCAGAARQVADLESTCMSPLDDEGAEGDVFLAPAPGPK
jgi:hypothetical protein